MVVSFPMNMEDKILHSCEQPQEYINRVAAAEFCCDKSEILTIKMEKGRGFSAHVHVSLKSTPEHLPGGRTGARLVSSCAGQGLEPRA